VPSIAGALRTDTHRRVLEMPIRDRIALALSLGDDDLGRFMRASGLDETDARRRLTAQRQRGRRPSGCARAARP